MREKSEQVNFGSVKHDGKLMIAKGNSRTAKHWKNTEMTWSALAQTLSTTRRTGETLEEYKKMPKSNQDTIKDVGGFVGGTLKEGRRLADAVAFRQVITLDADHPSGSDLWDDFQMMIGCAGLVYSTHKHQPDNPRLRLVIPLKRAVTAEEYQPIARKIAEWLGIDQFDDTTYQPHRLMYYPSTSSNGVFRFEFNDTDWLDPDWVLGQYPDWRDTSYWAESSRQSSQLTRSMKKQGDPNEKPGIVGSFCRTYDIPLAIETFLSDAYTEAGPDRYTFNGGSTTAGLILYENGKFAYSHHGTDPVSGRLVNAFDLVRLHLYGDEDSDVSAETPVVKHPSYIAMRDQASNDLEVKKNIMNERMQEMKDDFEHIKNTDLMDDDLKPDDSWLVKIKFRNGVEAQSIDNAFEVMMHKPELRGTFGVNEFTGRVNVRKDLPWRTIKEGGSLWTDTDDANLRHFLEKTHNLEHKGNIETAFLTASDKNKFHPVREYLNSLKWDGTPRLDDLLVHYLGADPSDYTSAVTRKTLVAAVARVMQPGIKFDYMLTLVGKQGIGKSSIFHRLAGAWFSDSFHTFQGKEAYEQLRGAWIVEMAELAAARKADVEALKQFITKQRDSYRVAYGRHVQDFDRQSIFIGTTNDYEFLRDRTGNRRFWVVEVGTFDPMFSIWDDLTPFDIDQIWAEAVTKYHAGEPLMLTGEDAIFAEETQKNHAVDSPMLGIIEEYLEKPITEDWYQRSIQSRVQYMKDNNNLIEQPGSVRREKVCALEIWIEALDGTRSNFKRADVYEVKGLLASLPGWKLPESKYGKLHFGEGYGAQRAYIRDNS